MIERQAVGDSPATVVAGDEEAFEAELLHDGNLVTGHRALGIRLVVGGGRRLGAVAVAAQVGDHHAEVLRQARRHQVPHHLGLRKAMQQQERRTVAAMSNVDDRLSGVDPGL